MNYKHLECVHYLFSCHGNARDEIHMPAQFRRNQSLEPPACLR